jgi:hypothetical protein
MEEIKITKELIKLIYNRTDEYANVKYGKFPDSIKLDDTGIIILEYEDRCGSIDCEYIDAEDLNSDLDEIRRVRMEQEEVERLKRMENLLIQQERQKLIDKANRKRQYLTLKKEFEDEDSGE